MSPEGRNLHCASDPTAPMRELLAPEEAEKAEAVAAAALLLAATLLAAASGMTRESATVGARGGVGSRVAVVLPAVPS